MGFFDRFRNQPPAGDASVKADKNAGQDTGIKAGDVTEEEITKTYTREEMEEMTKVGPEASKAPEYVSPFEPKEGMPSFPPKDMTGVDFSQTAEQRRAGELEKMKANREKAILRGDRETAEALRRAIAEHKSQSL